MASIITLPAIVADATDAVVQSWLVSVGDTVEHGQPVADIETEKATVELEAEASGTVSRLLVEAGSIVHVGAPILLLTDGTESSDELDVLLSESVRSEEPREPVERDTSTEPDATPTNHVADARIFISPLARRRARERGIDPSALTGSGPGGRILRRDVENAITSPRLTPVNDVVDETSNSDYEKVELTSMRKAIARRLTESKTQVPHFYVSVDVDMDALFELRTKINASLTLEIGSGARSKVSVNDLCVKALGLALRDVPEANVAWGGDHLRRFRHADIAVAIATDGGLLTPVVRKVESLSISALTEELSDYKQRASSGKIRQQELEGGTFSLSNLGMFGTREFSAILNPPQAGILALGAAEKRAVVRENQLQIATQMTATLSADHRAIDGAVAAQLLAAFQQRLENPLGLLV
ncbi:MAG: dihydrolipoamide acetyltransferase family protein [Micrococcaceae bacterium]